MLIHADRRNFVERAGFVDGAIVLEADVDIRIEPVAGHHASGPVELAAAYGNPYPVDLMPECSPAQKRAPAAADVEDAISGLEHQLAADMVEFLALSLVDVLGSIPEVSAGIDQVFIEPEFVKFVRDIVVSLDLPGVTCAGNHLRRGTGQNLHQARCERDAVDETGDLEADMENVAHRAFDRYFA